MSKPDNDYIYVGPATNEGATEWSEEELHLLKDCVHIVDPSDYPNVFRVRYPQVVCNLFNRLNYLKRDDDNIKHMFCRLR